MPPDRSSPGDGAHLPRLERQLNNGGHVRQLQAIGSAINGTRPAPLPDRGGVAQLMPADDIRTGRWYMIEGVETPRYLKTRRFTAGAPTRWEFHTHPLGAAEGETPLIVEDPALILSVADPAPIASARKWGRDPTDSKIFGLDGRDEASVAQAIDTGFRCFDAARTYAFGAGALAALCRQKGLARSDYKVVYKIGHHETREGLDEVIREALRALGYIDVLMVHESNDRLTDSIEAINDFIAKGLVKTGGLSNVPTDDLNGIDEAQLKNMVMLQYSVGAIKEAKQTDLDPRPEKRLADLGIRTRSSVYSLHSDIVFGEAESMRLRELGVTEGQARIIWAAHRGLDEVTTTGKPVRMQENFSTPQVRNAVAEEVTELVERSLLAPVQAEAPDYEWTVPELGLIHDAALTYATSNDLETFLARLNEIVAPPSKIRKLFRFTPLNLTSNDVSTQNIYRNITWEDLLKGDERLGATCNRSGLLRAIAAAVKRINDAS